MMNRWSWVSLLFILVSANAWAEQDFYGIQMKSEEWGRALVYNETYPDPSELAAGPVLDHAIHAEASLKEIPGGLIDFHVTLFNDSGAAIPTDYHYRDFLVYTRDGKKYSLIDTEEDLPPFIDPRSKMAFSPSFGNLRIRNSEVVMIVCSFDVGRTKVLLFPWSKKDTVSKLVSPQPPAEPAEPVRAEKRKPAKKETRPAPEKGPRKKTPKRNFWDWLALDDKKRVTPEELKHAPVMPTAVEKPAPAAPAARAPEGDVSPETKQKLDQAIQNFVYTPSSAAPRQTGTPVPAPAAAKVRSQAYIIDYNKPYNFVMLNLGEQDGLKKDMTLSIVRDGRLVAKAKVKQVRAAVSAATVIPESVRSEIHSGDGVAFV